MHALKVLVFMNKTKSFKDILLKKDLCAETKQKKAFKINKKAIKALTRA
jgi:hypothetical protein